MVTSFKSPRLVVFELVDNSVAYQQQYLLQRIPEILTPRVVKNLPGYFHDIDCSQKASIWLEKMVDESRLFVVNDADERTIGFLFVNVENEYDAHIGYLLMESSWGQGLASELIEAFIINVAQQEPWQKLIGGVEPANKASSDLLQKLGFRKVLGSEAPVDFYEYLL